MMTLFDCPEWALRLANRLLGGGLALLLAGLFGAYGLDVHLGLHAQVAAHSLVILGPSLLKLGYVLRLVAQQRLKRLEGPCCAAA